MNRQGRSLLMCLQSCIQRLFPTVPQRIRKGLRDDRFRHNNIRTLFLSAFLIPEQLFYALVMNDAGTLARTVFLITASGLVPIFLISLHFYRNKPQRTTPFHTLFSLSLTLFGLGIAAWRLILTGGAAFSLPTIFTAALYATAVIYSFSYLQSAVIYGMFALCSVLLYRHFGTHTASLVYAADIISNTAIAWIIAAFNYRSTMTVFLGQQMINTMNRELVEISERDHLTGLFNRRKTETIVLEEYLRYTRYGTVFSIMIIDIDWFKRINDKHGHATGDEGLVAFTDTLTSNLRDTDVAGRWGGEEFIIVCRESTLTQAGQFAERLRAVIAETSFSFPEDITASFGVASITEAETVDDLINLADSRLYQAKEAGRNCVVHA